MHRIHVLRVFTGVDGRAGNPLGVALDGAAVPTAPARQELAARLGFSETIFVDDPHAGAVAIFTPVTELPFAGHPLVGAAWLLAREGIGATTLHPPAGELAARADAAGAYITGRPEWAPSFELTELGSPAAVEALPGPPGGHDLVMAWAWSGPASVRARVFPPRLGITEDEATGSAAVRLGALLGRPITIHQGIGSVIEVRPLADGLIEIGGGVALDRVETLAAV